MSKREKVWGLSIALVGTLLGAALPLGAGCRLECASDLPERSFRILAGRAGWELDSGIVDLREETIVMEYRTLDGSRWQVEYLITEESGPKQ